MKDFSILDKLMETNKSITSSLSDFLKKPSAPRSLILDEVIKQNKINVFNTKNSIYAKEHENLTKKRTDLNKKLLDEDKRMDECIEKLLPSVNDKDLKIVNDKAEKYFTASRLYAEKLKELEENPTNNAEKIRFLYEKLADMEDDKKDEIFKYISDSMIKECVKDEGTEAGIWIRRSTNKEILRRQEVLKQDKLLREEEKNLFSKYLALKEEEASLNSTQDNSENTKQDSVKKEKSSLTEDFGDPSLKQSSFTDPGD